MFVDEVHYQLTDRCNLSCAHCFQSRGQENTVAPETVLSHLRLLAGRGINRINFTGGEPLHLPHIAEVVRFAKRCGMYVVLFTNARTYGRELDTTLLENVDLFRLSVDGPNAAVHDSIRTEGSFADVELAMHQLDRAKKPYRAVYTVQELNVDVAPEALGEFIRRKLYLQEFCIDLIQPEARVEYCRGFVEAPETRAYCLSLWKALRNVRPFVVECAEPAKGICSGARTSTWLWTSSEPCRLSKGKMAIGADGFARPCLTADTSLLAIMHKRGVIRDVASFLTPCDEVENWLHEVAAARFRQRKIPTPCALLD